MLKKKRFAMLTVALISLAIALAGTAPILADDPPSLTPTPPHHSPTRGEEERTSVDSVSGEPIELVTRYSAYDAKRYQIGFDQEITVQEWIEVAASTHQLPRHPGAVKEFACPSLLDPKLCDGGAPAPEPPIQY